ncbi:MAG: hypothetical protein QM651_14720 [Rhodoblastus sp.]
MIEVARALQELPSGTAKGCLVPLVQAQEQLATIRSRFVQSEIDLGPVSESSIPLLRGEPFDQKLRAVMSSVSTALQTAHRLAADERQEASDPEPSVTPPGGPALGNSFNASLNADKELRTEREQLSNIAKPGSIAADTLGRRLTDVIILNRIGFSEMRMPRVLSSRVRRIGEALHNYPDLLERAADAMQAGADFFDYASDKWGILKKRIRTSATETVREIATDLKEWAAKLDRKRVSDKPPQSVPTDFDIERATNMLHAGEELPEHWKELVVHMPLRQRRIRHIHALKGLINLQVLNRVSVNATGFATLSDLSSLTTLDLNDTSIKDLDPIKSLNRLQFINLNRTKVTSLSALSSLKDVRSLDIADTTVSDGTVINNFGIIPLTQV